MIDKALFTPGPWTTNPIDRMEIIETCDEPALVATTIRTGGDDEGIANARLIAAAPDLLAACEELLRWMEERGYLPPCNCHARDAITKAKGGAK